MCLETKLELNILGTRTNDVYVEMKSKSSPSKAAAKAGLTAMVENAVGMKRTKRGPEPERLKITGNWEDAVATALRKPKPPGGWPKR